MKTKWMSVEAIEDGNCIDLTKDADVCGGGVLDFIESNFGEKVLKGVKKVRFEVVPHKDGEFEFKKEDCGVEGCTSCGIGYYLYQDDSNKEIWVSDTKFKGIRTNTKFDLYLNFQS